MLRDFVDQYTGANDQSACEAVYALQIATFVQILAGDTSLIFQVGQPEGELLLELWREQTKRLLYAHGAGWNASYTILAANAPPPGDFPGFMDSALANIDNEMNPATFWGGYQQNAINDTEGKLNGNGAITGGTGAAYRGSFETPAGALATALQPLGTLPTDSTADDARQAVETALSAIVSEIGGFPTNTPEVDASLRCTGAMTVLNAAFWLPRGS